MITSRIENGILTLYAEGRIEAVNAPDFGEELFAERRSCPDLPLILDAGKLDYICSAGLREILRFFKSEKKLKITNANEIVYETFDITGFTDFLDIEKPVQENACEVEGINNTTWNCEFTPAVRMFEKCVNETPDKLAVVSSERSLTYSELNDEANRIANALLFSGIRADDLVMILLPRSIDAYVANLGVMKAGAAYIVANTEYPDERIQYMFENAGCKYLITTHDICFDRLDLIIDIRKRPLFFENIVTFDRNDNPRQRIDERDLAYCIYTSGSTGKPKGVLIEQENLSNFLHHNPKNYETMGIVERGNVVLAIAPLTFDVSIMEEFISLTSGKTVALASDDQIRNPLLMKEFMEENNVDAMLGTPSYIDMLLSLPQLKDTMSKIAVYDFGAEAFIPTTYDKIQAINPDAYIMNGYGPTETTISCTMKVITSSENITIGIPNSNVYAYIVDENNNEVPNGTVGELLIAGKGVGRGYMKLPEKTAEVFIDFNGQKAYKTGDLARITENGEIEYHGRRDNQVKLHGLRIELGEIEENMVKCDGIESCAAVVIDGRYMCLYYVASGSITVDEVKAYAKSHLAHYMVPDLFEQIEKMPLTANMKIDRKALPRPTIAQKEIKKPQTEVQKKLVDIFSGILKDTELSVDENFFDCGISSIEVIMLLADLGDEFQVVLKTADVYENPTIEKLEAMLANAPKIVAAQKKDKYPCTLTQMGDFAQWARANSSSLLLPYLSELDASIDLDRLKNAIRTAAVNHPILFARYMPEGQMIYQIPCEDEFKDFEIDTIEISDSEFEKIHNDLANELFPFGTYPLFRFRIYKTETRTYLYSAFHHIISDGESVSILFKEIADAYEQKKLKSERMSMYEVGEETMKYMMSPLMGQCIGYYMNLMEGRNSFSSIPADFDSADTKPGFTKIDIKADRAVIEEKCSNMGVSINELFAGILGLAIAKVTGERDSAYPLGYNGRNDSRLSNSFGCYAGIILVRCAAESGTTLKDYLAKLRRQIVNAMSFPTVPYQQMSESFTNFLDICFIYQPSMSESFEIGGTVAKTEYMIENCFSAGCKANIQASNTENGFVFTCDYHANIYKKETIDALFSEINDMLNRFNGDDLVSSYIG